MSVIIGFVVGLIAGAVIWLPVGWLLADDGAYMRGVDDTDKGWRASLSKDQPFRCNAVPLSPDPRIVVRFPDVDHLERTAR